MRIIVVRDSDIAEQLTAELRKRLPNASISVNAELQHFQEVDVVVARAPTKVLLRKVSMRLLIILGHGLDGVPSEETGTAKVIRAIDPSTSLLVSQYVAHEVIGYYRRFHDYRLQQQEARWNRLPISSIENFRVGVLGLGKLGQASALCLTALGFTVQAWSRNLHMLPGIVTYSGLDNLYSFLKGCSVLICLLPLTSETQRILNLATLQQLPYGAYLINLGRGELVCESGILTALDTGLLSHVSMDVFAQEPLPPNHPFWCHPKITITPHVAGQMFASAKADAICQILNKHTFY
jgi:glyoxylate/hydroxypyruvate reductase A